MKTLQFNTTIEASPERVWDVMLGPDTYRQWAAEFMEGSYFEGSWEQGAKIRFLGPDGNGMSSVIAESRPHEFVSIKHIGFIDAGKEDTGSESVRAWAPMFENYTFLRTDGGTELRIDMDTTPEWESMFQDHWPKALQRLKELCEAKVTG